jgi:hypothetical protein
VAGLAVQVGRVNPALVASILRQLKLAAAQHKFRLGFTRRLLRQRLPYFPVQPKPTIQMLVPQAPRLASRVRRENGHLAALHNVIPTQLLCLHLLLRHSRARSLARGLARSLACSRARSQAHSQARSLAHNRAPSRHRNLARSQP